jgi:hypothetical protein
MHVGQPREGSGASGTLASPWGRAVCQVDDLGRLPHDDLMIQRGKIFNCPSLGALTLVEVVSAITRH